MKNLITRLSPSGLPRETAQRQSQTEPPAAGSRRSSHEFTPEQSAAVRMALEVEGNRVKVRFKLDTRAKRPDEKSTTETRTLIPAPKRGQDLPLVRTSAASLASHALSRNSSNMLVSAAPLTALPFNASHLLQQSDPQKFLAPWQRLHLAVKSGDCRAVAEFLWRTPFRIDDVDEFGRTALHVALSSRVDWDMPMILMHGVEGVAADVNARTNFGLAPLHYAAARGHFELLHALIQRGADPAAITAFGATADQIARHHGYDGLANWLHSLCSPSLPARPWRLAPEKRAELAEIDRLYGSNFTGRLLGLRPERVLTLLVDNGR